MCIYVKLSTASAQAKGGVRVAMACSEPAVAGYVKQTAVAVLDQGVSKAMAFRVKISHYN